MEKIDIIGEIKKLEKDFEDFKKKVSKYHKIYLLIYFMPPLIAILIFSRFFETYFKVYLKVLLYFILLLGLVVHFFIRNRFYKSREGYKKFIQGRMDSIKNYFDTDESFKEKSIDAVRTIFLERGMEFSNTEISKNDFYYLIFSYFGL